jgi:integrase
MYDRVRESKKGEDITMANGRVRKRGNSWQYIINLSYDEKSGKYPQIHKGGFEKQADAKEALTAALAELSAKSGIPAPKITLQQYLSEWINGLSNVKPRTKETYEYTVGIINNYLGATPLGKLQHPAIEKMYRALEDSGKAASSVHRVHRVLRTALNRAVRRGIIDRSPMARVDPPSGKVERRHTLNAEQVFALLDWMNAHHPISFIGVMLAINTGLRRGEICGLLWGDIDFERGIIRIVQSRQRRKGVDLIDTPKTKGSIRSIPLAADVLASLKAWQEQQGATEKDFVLAHPDQTPIDPMSLARDMRKAVKALNLPDVSFHDLRHTHATLLLANGVNIKVVSERLGHTSITQTANTYAHVTQNMQEEATERIATILKRP